MKIIKFLTISFLTLSCSILFDDNENSSKKDKIACAATQIVYYSDCNNYEKKQTQFCKNSYMQCTVVCALASSFGCGF